MDLAAQRLSKTDMIYADIKKSIMGNEFSSDTPLFAINMATAARPYAKRYSGSRTKDSLTL